MPNQRDKSKKLVGFYATPDEQKALKAIAKKRGISLSELLRQLAAGALKLLALAFLAFHVTRSPKRWTAAALKQTAAVAWTHVQSLAR